MVHGCAISFSTCVMNCPGQVGFAATSSQTSNRCGLSYFEYHSVISLLWKISGLCVPPGPY